MRLQQSFIKFVSSSKPGLSELGWGSSVSGGWLYLVQIASRNSEEGDTAGVGMGRGRVVLGYLLHQVEGQELECKGQ